MTDFPERRLAAAILARAVRDVRDGNGHSVEARRWLRSDYARNLFDALGIHPGVANEWIETQAAPAQIGLPGIFEEA
jgi:hypothetical protein